MMNRKIVWASLAAICVHVFAGLLVSIPARTHHKISDESPAVEVTMELKDTQMIIAHVSKSAKVEDLTRTMSFVEEHKDNDPADASLNGPAEIHATIEETPRTIEPERTEQRIATSDEPPYLIDTPPKFIERGPISFPNDIKNLTESISIVVYLSLGAHGEILSLEAMTKREEFKLEVIKMILKSKFSPAYVGDTPVPCMAKCVVDIVCKPVDL